MSEKMQRKNLVQPDETRTSHEGKVELVTIGGVTLGGVTPSRTGVDVCQAHS